jgi:cell division protein DivIC
MARPGQQQQNNTVKALNNDYVRSNEVEQYEQRIKQKQKIFMRRRLAMYVIIASIICLGMFDFLLHQRERLDTQKAELAATQQELEKANEQQEMLGHQISKLEDDEYIAKLARKEYFLSEEGEIIFTIPDKDDVKDEKNNNK